MHNQREVTMKQVSSDGVSATLWHRLKEAHRNGTLVELEGHTWAVSSFTAQLRNEGSVEVATIRRT